MVLTYDSRNGFFGGVGIKLGIALLLICVNSSIHNILLKEDFYGLSALVILNYVR